MTTLERPSKPLPNKPLPSKPLPNKPAGYLELASYSSLGRVWGLLAGAQAAGRKISLIRGDLPETCRRRISGFSLENAAIFLDFPRLATELEDGFEVHPAVIELMSGNLDTFKQAVNQNYLLQTNVVVALTANRDLIVRPEFRFVLRPLQLDKPEIKPLPNSLNLPVRRLGRDEVQIILQKACGLA